MHVAGKHVTVMGLGRHGGGLSVARYLAREGAQVTVTDTASADELAPSVAALADVPISRYALAGHRRADFESADIVVVNPAVRPGNPFVEIARQAGATITSEMEFLLTACPARTIGVTGSNGKSTTAAMLAAILRTDQRTAWLGGNIGHSLLERLPEIGPEDWVVLEWSSFQLAGLSEHVRGPDVAVVTNCTANHLDWHGDMSHYVAAKRRILNSQRGDSLALLNPAAAELADWRPLVRGDAIQPVTDDQLPPLAVPGVHNRQNAACAAGVARAIGCSDAVIGQGLASYRAMPHRLQRVTEVRGRVFYDDSQATTPESVMAALAAIDSPLWLLAGGHDKGCLLEPLAAAIVARALGAFFFGATRDRMRSAVYDASSSRTCYADERLEDAFARCWDVSRPGDVILLSPGCASHDQFRDCSHRAETFRELIRRLAAGPTGREQGHRRANPVAV